MSLSSLKGKYDGFMAAAFKITVGDTEIASNKCANLVVDQCVGAVSGGCSFTVLDFYNKVSRKMSSDADTFQVGKTVKVSMGYGSTLKAVFTGYIAQIAYQFEEEVMLTVNCLDGRALMRLSKPAVIRKEKTVEDIAKEIFGKYSPVIASNDVTLPALETGNIPVDIDDLSFIMSESEKRGKAFFIRDDKAFIADPKGDECLSLDWEEYHITFRMNYLNMAFNGIGFDTATMEGYTQRTVCKQPGTQTNITPQEYFVRLNPSLSSANGKSIIASMVQNTKLQCQTGTITCVGVPEIEVGKMVTLTKPPFESICGGKKFFVTAVRHSMNPRFETTFEISLGAE